VLVDTSAAAVDAETFVERCADVDVLGGAMDAETVRFCTHLGIERTDIETALARIDEVV